MYTDPTGNFSSLSAGINGLGTLMRLVIPRVLNLGSTATKAVATVCLSQMVGSMIGAEISPATNIMAKRSGCEMNQMRVQLQQGSNHTISKVAHATPNPGVTANHLRAKLKQLFLAKDEGGWFPGELESWMYRSIVSLSIKIGKIPPHGVIQGGTILTQQLTHRGKNFRIDIENLRGHNLRR